jgi:putative FmdB family regulatory protein
MPVFEYKCSDCNSKYEIYHKSSVKQEEVVCPECHSGNHKKLLSSFSASVGSSDFSYNDCSSGNCGVSPSPGGCASGMCGLN